MCAAARIRDPRIERRPQGRECPPVGQTLTLTGRRAGLSTSHHKTEWNSNCRKGVAYVSTVGPESALVASARAPSVSVEAGRQRRVRRRRPRVEQHRPRRGRSGPYRRQIPSSVCERFEPMPGGQIATALSVCARLGWTAELHRPVRRRRPRQTVASQPDGRRRRHLAIGHRRGRDQPVRRRPGRRAERASARCYGTGIPG